MIRVLYNAKVYVERDVFESAIMIEGDSIKAVGSDFDILNACENLSETQIEKIDCEGKTVIPGIIDSHIHMYSTGAFLSQPPIDKWKSIDEIINGCKEYIKTHESVQTKGLHAFGWNHNSFVGEKRIPTRFDLDKISTEIPIVLERVCGHILSTNTKAIEMLGLDGNSPQWDGGFFEIGEDNYPNGIFNENACRYPIALIPEFTEDEVIENFLKSIKSAHSFGITGVMSNDIGLSVSEKDKYFERMRNIYQSNKVYKFKNEPNFDNSGNSAEEYCLYHLIRYKHKVSFNTINEFQKFIDTEFANKKTLYPEDGLLSIGTIKIFKDGSLGASTATMRDGYYDDKSNFGVEVTTNEDMLKFIRLADKAGIQVVIHAIGDKAIEDVINCFEDVIIYGNNKNRHGIVHCQITDKGLLERIAKNDILVLFQPIFLECDMHVVENRCGKELASTSYATATMEKLGIHISYGTDSPVESCNPFPNIYQAVTRQCLNGFPEGGFYPEECVDVYTAVDAYTEAGAHAMFRENDLGRIKENFKADLVILDKDIFSIPNAEIKDIKPVMTIQNGEIVYRA